MNAIYEIGQQVWVAILAQNETKVECPVCFTKKVVTVILGDGSEVEVGCDYCKKGYESPTGYVMPKYLTVARAEQRIITGVDIRQSKNGTEITYWFSGSGYKYNMISDTKEGALEKATLVIEERNEQKRKRNEEQKHNRHKSYSWHIGYYKQRIKRAEDDIERYKKKIKFMKPKARPRKEP